MIKSFQYNSVHDSGIGVFRFSDLKAGFFVFSVQLQKEKDEPVTTCDRLKPLKHPWHEELAKRLLAGLQGSAGGRKMEVTICDLQLNQKI